MPLTGCVLQVSGRAGFELVRRRRWLVCRSFGRFRTFNPRGGAGLASGITLAGGFVRGDSLVAYSRPGPNPLWLEKPRAPPGGPASPGGRALSERAAEQDFSDDGIKVCRQEGRRWLPSVAFAMGPMVERPGRKTLRFLNFTMNHKRGFGAPAAPGSARTGHRRSTSTENGA